VARKLSLGGRGWLAGHPIFLIFFKKSKIKFKFFFFKKKLIEK